MTKKIGHNGTEWVAEETIELEVSAFEELIELAGFALDCTVGKEARDAEEFINSMKSKLDPEEPDVEWVTVVPLNAAPFVAKHFDLNEDDDDDDDDEWEDGQLLTGWKWPTGKKRIGTWKDLLVVARSKKAKILLPGQEIS